MQGWAQQNKALMVFMIWVLMSGNGLCFSPEENNKLRWAVRGGMDQNK